METDVSQERAKAVFKKATIGVIVLLTLIFLITGAMSTRTYQPPQQVQHSQEYLDLREYHIASHPYKSQVMQSTGRMGLLLYDLFEMNGEVNEKWVSDFTEELATMEESIMASTTITPPPDHIYELYALFFMGVGELDKALEALYTGISQANDFYFLLASNLALDYIEKAVLLFTQYNDKVTEYERRYRN